MSAALPIPMPSNRELAIVAGAAVLAGLALYIVTRPGVAQGAARSATNAAAGVVVGVVKGVGDAVGLPDPADPATLAEGRAALARGDYYEASMKLPAAEFLGALGQVAIELSPIRAITRALTSSGIDTSTYVGDLPIDPAAGGDRVAAADIYSGSGGMFGSVQ